MARADDQSMTVPYASGDARRSWWTPAMTVEAIVLAAILGWHYRHVLDRLVYIWSHSGDWSHGFIIPLFSLYYLYMQRDRMPRDLPDYSKGSRLAGALVLLAAFALYLQCTFVRMEYPKTVALVLSVFGSVLLVCGWPLTRWSWFAIAFLIFAMPLPHRLYQEMTLPLRQVATTVSGMVLSLVPEMIAEARGTVVEYIYRGRSGQLDIERACSGMRLMMTMTALGVAMAFVNERPMWQRLVMILSCIPIAIFCNIIRVTTTGFFVVFDRAELARGAWHTMLGLGMLAIAFALYGGLSYVLSHLFVETGDDEGE